MFHPCPYCNRSCLSSLQKIFLSSINSTSCRSCGEAVSIPRSYLIAQFVVLVVYLVAARALALDPAGMIGVGIGLVVLLLLIQLKFAPLTKSGSAPGSG